jgi:hypothetical protein
MGVFTLASSEFYLNARRYMKTLLVVMLSLVFLVPIAVAGDPSVLVRFNGGIGVDPVGGISLQGAPVPNTVCDLAPGGLPWVIRSLKAKIRTDGSIRVEGRGLVLAGGNTVAKDVIGGAPTSLSVEAELFCDTTATACGTPSISPSVTLAANGDFTITGSLSPAPPATCTKPVLLIIGVSTDHWLAAGIPKD